MFSDESLISKSRSGDFVSILGQSSLLLLSLHFSFILESLGSLFRSSSMELIFRVIE